VRFESGSKLSIIEECAFVACLALKSIRIPSSIRTIANSGFANYGRLARIVLEDGCELTDSQISHLRRIGEVTIEPRVQSNDSEAGANDAK
jgi:hypothetical protein